MEVQAPNSKKKTLLCLLLGLGTLALYLPSVRFDFLAYDDQQYVTENPHVQAGLTLRGLVWAFGFHAGNWHPLTWLSHMLDCQLYGLHPGGHHLTNALLYAANTVLLLLVLSRMTGAVWRSVSVAALFGWHPLHVESAAWVAERKDVLSGLFFMLTLLAYGNYVEAKSEVQISKPEGVSKIERKRSALKGYCAVYLLTLLFFALGLMSKPMVVTLPFVLLLLDYWPLQRFQLAVADYKLLFRLVLEKVPFLLLAAMACVLTVLAQTRVHAVVSTAGLPISTRVSHTLLSYAHYVGAMFWPRHLAVYYPYETTVSSLQVICAACVLALISIVAIRFGKRLPYLLVGWLWFLGTLVPVIGLVQVGEQAWADRYTYLPSIGLFVAVVWGIAEKLQAPNPNLLRQKHFGGQALHRSSKLQTPKVEFKSVSSSEENSKWRRTPEVIRTLLKQFSLSSSRSCTPLKQGVNESAGGFLNWPWLTHLKFVASILIGATLLTLTSIQLRYWSSTRTLFEHAAAVTQNNYMAVTLLGSLSAKEGKFDEAIEQYKTALNWKPGYPEAHFFLGNALDQQGTLDDAIAEYKKALWFKPMQEQTHIFLGAALAKQRKFEEAIFHYVAALKLNPESAVAHNNLARVLQSEGRLDEAMEHFSAALKFDPGLAQAHNNLGVLLLARGRTADGVRELREASRLNPGDLEIEYNLALALNQQQQWSAVAELFGKVLEKKSNDANAHCQLAVALTHLQRTREAMSHYASALLIQPDFPDALDGLAWILATAPNPTFRNGTEAARMAERACELTNRKDAQKLRTLAAAYAEGGRFADAVSTIEIVIHLGSSSFTNGQSMLEVFKTSKPWRDPEIK